MTNAEDDILVRRALRADPESFGQLCYRYYHSLVAVADSILRDHHLAEDAAEAKPLHCGFHRPAANRRRQLMQIGRCIMTSRYMRLASVAAVVLVALAFLFPGVLVADSIGLVKADAPGTVVTLRFPTDIEYGPDGDILITTRFATSLDPQRTFDTPQNWTVHGADTLSRSFRGNPASQGQNAATGGTPTTNGPAPLYVGVQDKAGPNRMAVHPNAKAVTSTDWQQRRICFSDLASGGVDLTTVKKLSIGVGDRTNAVRAVGLLYVDDIGVGHPAQ